MVDGSEFFDVNAALSSLNRQLKKARKEASQEANLRHIKEVFFLFLFLFLFFLIDTHRPFQQQKQSSKWRFVEGKDFNFTKHFSNISDFVGQRHKKQWIEINLPGQSFVVARAGQKGRVIWQSGSRRFIWGRGGRGGRGEGGMGGEGFFLFFFVVFLICIFLLGIHDFTQL